MRLLRSPLFAPGNHARRVEKALGLSADAVILDLEDAVAIAEKPAARDTVAAVLGAPRRSAAYVRVNAMSTEWCYADLVAVARPGLDGIVLPKAESADQIKTADWVISALERERGLPRGKVDLIPIIETARGYAEVAAVAAGAARVRRLAFGAGDFTLDLALTWTREEAELAPFRAGIVAASRAAGIEAPLDTVWADLRDPEGFGLSAARAAALGFQGKMCIHPDQVAVANAAFTPDARAAEQARRIVAAFAEAEAKGLAAIQLDGQFVDYPIVHRARRLVERFEAAQRGN
jgi:citrate lyase subunit beta/citryl-CoA lyase